MEHRLIFGGEQYLPYARARIRALRRVGRYGSGRWEMPGGELVEVRIDGEHDYIRIEGGSSLIAMDSGIVDYVGTGLAPRYVNGTLRHTSSTLAYTSGFALPDPNTGAWANWRGGRGVVGSVEIPSFMAHVRDDYTRCASFEATREPVTTDSEEWQYKSNDSYLYAKKRLVDKCPASVFTGRARMYVQAMYGKPLYEYGSDASTAPKVASPVLPSLASEAPPSLSIPAYKHKDEPDYPPVTMTTSAGVRFDAATGNHWLIVVNTETLSVFPLKSTTTGEGLRKYLRGEDTSTGSPLSLDDREKLEAFVLAYSLPDVKNGFSVSCPNIGNSYAMGYGWHWNWSATAADIVNNSTYDQDASHQGMESTHRRISLSVSEEGAWSASVSVVEGPKRWAVSRVAWCIAEPEWGNGAMLKSTPRNSNLDLADAPFYVFYVRDELKVCRAIVTFIAGTAGVREFSVGFCSPTYGTTVDMFTAGLQAGYCRDLASTTGTYALRITCGAASTPEMKLNTTSTSANWEVADKYLAVQPARNPASDGSLSSPTYTFTSGYTPPFGTPTYTTISAPAIITTDSPPIVGLTRRTYDEVSSISSYVTAIVPFYDAEALFFDGTEVTSSYKSNIQIIQRESSGFGLSKRYFPVVGSTVGPISDFFIEWITAGTAGTTISSSSPDPQTIDTVVPHSSVVSVAGTLTASMPDLVTFHNTDDYATATYSMRTGVRTSSPVAIAGLHLTAQGAPQGVPDFPAIVGWV